MKKPIIILCLLAASIFAGPYELLETNQKPGTVTGPVWQGDLSQIHAAYQRRDLKTLWKVYDAVAFGGLAPPDREKVNITINTKEVIAKVNEIVRDYSGRLLSQIPGHAKYVGDAVEVLAADPNSNGVVRTYLELLAKLASDECLYEIGRFWDDERGRLSPNVEAESMERFKQQPKTDAFLLLPSSVKDHARNAMWDARVFYPWKKNGRKTPMPVTTGQDIKGEIAAWWNSPAAAKYHQPPDLTRQPPPEPPPERFDIQALYKAVQQEKEQAAKAPPPLPPAPPRETPLADDSSEEWPWYLALGLALACLLGLHLWRRKAQ